MRCPSCAVAAASFAVALAASRLFCSAIRLALFEEETQLCIMLTFFPAPQLKHAKKYGLLPGLIAFHRPIPMLNEPRLPNQDIKGSVRSNVKVGRERHLLIVHLPI